MLKIIRYSITWILMLTSTIIGIVCIFLKGNIHTIDVGTISLSIPFIVAFVLAIVNIIFNLIWHYVVKFKNKKEKENNEKEN